MSKYPIWKREIKVERKARPFGGAFILGKKKSNAPEIKTDIERIKRMYAIALKYHVNENEDE